MHCTRCQTEIPQGSQFCPGCGQHIAGSPQTSPSSAPVTQTLWAGHPTIRSFEGTFFLAVFLVLAGPILYGLSYISPFAVWVLDIQAYIDIAWSTVADLLSLTDFVPGISLIAILATSLVALACVLFVKLWVWSRQIQYRLTPQYLIVINGFLTRTHKQLSLTTIADLKLEPVFSGSSRRRGND